MRRASVDALDVVRAEFATRRTPEMGYDRNLPRNEKQIETASWFNIPI